MRPHEEAMEREAFLLDLGISSAWTQRHLLVELAPPLDDRAKDRLRALVQQKLPEASAKVLFDLIAAFPSSWGAEYGKILKEECLGSPGLREWHQKEEQHRTAKTKYIPTVRILAYGPPQQESMLSGALRERIPHARVAFSPWPGDLPPPKTIQGSDAGVCLSSQGPIRNDSLSGSSRSVRTSRFSSSAICPPSFARLQADAGLPSWPGGLQVDRRSSGPSHPGYMVAQQQPDRSARNSRVKGGNDRPGQQRRSGSLWHFPSRPALPECCGRRIGADLAR